MDIRERLVELLKGNLPYHSNDIAYWQEEHVASLADHLIANGVTIGKDIDAPTKWIPVTERLPEDGEQVLACTKHGKAFSAHCERGRFRVSGSVTVTHWMPLPEEPKGE